MNLADLNLRINPFEYLTPIQGEVKFWAGLSDIKKSIETVYHNAFKSNSRNLILNYGTFGGGKTYAAYYFKQKEFEHYDNNQILNIYTLPPGDGNKITQQLFYDIIDGITINRLKSLIKRASTELGEDELYNYIFNKINSDEYSKAIINLGKEGNILNSKKHILIKKYIYGNITAKELSELEIDRKLSTDSDYRKFLSGLLLAVSASSKPVRIFLWLDELESLVYYTSKQYREFSQIIRYLVDTVGTNFTVFMNFTFSEAEDENVRMLIGEALWSRINDKIHFQPLNQKEALVYCKDIIKHSQIDKSKDDFNPFEKSVLEEVFKEMKEKNLIPREINRKINSIIQFALEREHEYIDMDLYKQWYNFQANSKF